jgi:transposase
MAQRRQFTDEFKKDAVRLMLARGTRTVEEVAAGIGVNSSVLYRWHQRFSSEVAGRPATSEQDREDVERMRRRLRELEQENALLKKAAALFAKEMK